MPAEAEVINPEHEQFPPRVEDLGPEPQPLAEFTEAECRKPSIRWYRTPLKPEQIRRMSTRSDLLGAAQTLGYLGILTATGVGSWYSAGHWPWWVTVVLVFLHGTVANFLINAVHELGHGTVFKTKALNQVFVHVCAFLGSINHELFASSHIRHHRYTLHPPDDLEVTLPIRLMVKHFWKTAFARPQDIWGHLKYMGRIAKGDFRGDWELTLYPQGAPEKSAAAVRWGRILLAGHGLILVASIATGQWMIPLLVSLNQFYGGWLIFLCNNTQHIGLRDNVPDFRLCCRTFTLNPLVRFLYWHMNYHTEHHMYPAAPCYRLGELHRMIRHDLPPTPHGLLAVWKEIAAIQARQDAEPGYQHTAPLPG